jgi:DNA invertase Pin-like site-specific DNA recombinase
MKTCYIYARTATISQYEHSKGRSKNLELQIKSCKQFAKENGYEVYKTFFEVASGTTFKRKELKKLLNYCKRVQVDALIISKIDRLSRNFSVYQEIREHLTKYSIALISVDDGDLTSPIGNLLGGIQVSVAQYELERSKAR